MRVERVLVVHPWQGLGPPPPKVHRRPDQPAPSIERRRIITPEKKPLEASSGRGKHVFIGEPPAGQHRFRQTDDVGVAAEVTAQGRAPWAGLEMHRPAGATAKMASLLAE